MSDAVDPADGQEPSPEADGRWSSSRLVPLAIIVAAAAVIAVLLFSARGEQDAGLATLRAGTVEAGSLPVTLPLRYVAGQVAVDVRLGDDETALPMLLDTGAPTAISDSLAAIHGGDAVGTVSTLTIDGQVTSSPVDPAAPAAHRPGRVPRRGRRGGRHRPERPALVPGRCRPHRRQPDAGRGLAARLRRAAPHHRSQRRGARSRGGGHPAGLRAGLGRVALAARVPAGRGGESDVPGGHGLGRLADRPPGRPGARRLGGRLGCAGRGHAGLPRLADASPPGSPGRRPTCPWAIGSCRTSPSRPRPCCRRARASWATPSSTTSS